MADLSALRAKISQGREDAKRRDLGLPVQDPEALKYYDELAPPIQQPIVDPVQQQSMQQPAVVPIQQAIPQASMDPNLAQRALNAANGLPAVAAPIPIAQHIAATSVRPNRGYGKVIIVGQNDKDSKDEEA